MLYIVVAEAVSCFMHSNKLKIINDAVYGFIELPNEAIYDLMQSIYVQRLRRIKQLGLSNLVYPGAEHTRFSHSLGAMYLMNKALDVLKRKGIEFSDDERIFALQAILMHDSGHSPFSHCLENFFFSCSHEEISSKFMRLCGLNNEAISIFTDSYPKHFLHHLVSSQIDVDRLDYLTRDSFFTGVSEGVIGTERIISMYNVKEDELVIDEKGIYSIEKFIIARRLMYWQVYMHKTVVGADCLLKNLLHRARFLSQNSSLQENVYPISAHLLYFLKNEAQCIDNEEALRHFVLLDDTDIWSSVKIWSQHKDKILRKLSSALMNRHLGHLIIQNKQFNELDKESLLEKLYKRYLSEGFSKEEVSQYFFYNAELHNKAYSFNDQGINILYKDGTLKEIYNASDQLDESFLSKDIKKYYCFILDR